jgi:predicted N-acetyltransferase YhbS
VKQESPIVGFACACGGEDELFGTMLDNLHVLQSQKGKGIGRKLVRDIASWCDRDYSAKGHFAQKHFYERLGGVVVGGSKLDCSGWYRRQGNSLCVEEHR